MPVTPDNTYINHSPYPKVIAGFYTPDYVPGPDSLPDDLVNPDTRPSALKILQKRTIAQVGCYTIIRKTKLYSPKRGKDVMIYAAKDTVASSVTDLSLDELTLAFKTATSVRNTYTDMKDEDELAMVVMSYNSHPDPVDTSEKTFNQKVHAQSLPDFHLHVTAFSKKAVSSAEPKPTSEIVALTNPQLDHDERVHMAVKEQADFRDPLTPFIQKLAAKPEVLQKLQEGLETITAACTPFGIRFSLPPGLDISDPGFAKDLQQLHANYHELYHEVASVFVDSKNVPDATGMPRVLDPDTITQNLTDFATRYDFKDDEPFIRHLSTIGKLLMSGEAAQTQNRTGFSRVFLRGPAYTVSIVDNLKGQREMIFSPRLISTGNMLSSLGYVINHHAETPSDYQEKSQHVYDAIAANLKALNQA